VLHVVMGGLEQLPVLYSVSSVNSSARWTAQWRMLRHPDTIADETGCRDSPSPQRTPPTAMTARGNGTSALVVLDPVGREVLDRTLGPLRNVDEVPPKYLVLTGQPGTCAMT